MLGAKYGFVQSMYSAAQTMDRTLRGQTIDCAPIAYAYISIAHARCYVGMRCAIRARARLV